MLREKSEDMGSAVEQLLTHLPVHTEGVMLALLQWSTSGIGGCHLLNYTLSVCTKPFTGTSLTGNNLLCSQKDHCLSVLL